MAMDTNRGLLLVVIVLLLGIGGYMIMEENRQPDTVGENIAEIGEEIGDEIDDATTAR